MLGKATLLNLDLINILSYVFFFLFFNIHSFIKKDRLCTLIFCIVFLFITTNNIWIFYITFELAIVPMIILIIVFGINPYRFRRGYFILLYTIIFSMPVIVVLLLNFKFYLCTLLSIKTYYISWVSTLWIIVIFFVKTPIYLLHFWLPKAHVEASTIGRILLAGYLLKIGRIGFIKFYYWLRVKPIFNFSYLIGSSCLVNFICMFQRDLKKLIALMSVRHMRLGLVSIILSFSCRYQIFFIININHTLISAIFFYVRGIAFKFSSTRILYLQQILKFTLRFYVYTLLIFINLGVPPFLSFFQEVLLISCLLLFNIKLRVLLILLIIFSCRYSLLLINNIKHYKFIKLKLTNFFIFIRILIICVVGWLLVI